MSTFLYYKKQMKKNQSFLVLDKPEPITLAQELEKELLLLFK